jgi:hypothetical protein
LCIVCGGTSGRVRHREESICACRAFRNLWATVSLFETARSRLADVIELPDGTLRRERAAGRHHRAATLQSMA